VKLFRFRNNTQILVGSPCNIQLGQGGEESVWLDPHRGVLAARTKIPCLLHVAREDVQGKTIETRRITHALKINIWVLVFSREEGYVLHRCVVCTYTRVQKSDLLMWLWRPTSPKVCSQWAGGKDSHGAIPIPDKICSRPKRSQGSGSSPESGKLQCPSSRQAAGGGCPFIGGKVRLLLY
jgi:hypothetical protein